MDIIVPRETVRREAQAAAEALAQGRTVRNPFPYGSHAADEWDGQVQRLRAAVEGEAT